MSNGTGGEKIPARAWVTLAILFVLYVVAMLDRQVIPLIIAPLKASLGLGNVHIALVHGVAFSLFYAIAGVPLGWAVDRASPRGLIFWGVVVWSLATVLSGLAGSFAGLFVCRLLVGVGEAALMPAAMVLLATAFPRERLSVATSTFMVASLMGGGFATALIGWVVVALSRGGVELVTLPGFGPMEPWRATFIVIGAPGTLFAALAWLLPRRPAPVAPAAGPQGEAGPGFMAWLRENRRFVFGHLGAFAFLGGGAYSIQVWGPAHLAGDFGWSPAQIGLAFAVIVGGFGTAGTFLSAAVVDSMFRRGVADAHDRYHFYVTLLCWPLAAGAFYVSDPWWFVALLAGAYLTLFGFGGTATAALQIVALPQHRGRLASLYGLAVTTGGAGFGPLVSALIEMVLPAGNHGGIATATSISMVLFAAGAVVCLAIARPGFVAAQQRRAAVPG